MIQHPVGLQLPLSLSLSLSLSPSLPFFFLSLFLTVDWCCCTGSDDAVEPVLKHKQEPSHVHTAVCERERKREKESSLHSSCILCD